MDFDKVARNTYVLAGLDGLKKLLGCIWCQDERRIAILKLIADKYGFVDLGNKKDNDLLPTLMENTPLSSSSSSDVRAKLAKKYKVSPSKVKPIGDGKFIIRGKVVESGE